MIEMKKLALVMISFLMVFVLFACSEEEPSTELDTRLTDALRLDREYEGKNFFEDGIAEATLATCIDGDTTRFYVNGENISVRYLAVDTPESTGQIEPWGKAASDFVCEKLERAETIVLEAEVPDQKGNYGRHLAYVWYDNRLLNLELMELAYSHASGGSDLKYADEFREAENKARETGRRIWGEDDPDFSDETIIIDFDELYNNIEEYVGIFVTIEAYVDRMERNNAYLVNEDGENEIFLFTGNTATPLVQPCFKLRFEDLAVTIYQGDYQLTNFSTRRVEVLDEDTEFCENNE